MKRKKLSLRVMSVLLLVAMCFTITSCTDTGTEEPALEEQVEITKTSFKTEFVNREKIQLSASSPMMMSTEDNTISQRITATVIPTTANNKKVDWSVAWGDETYPENVSDYISVIPDSDGSDTATVVCKAAFDGNIIITATTRQNGYSADCIVTFVGVPANIDLTTNLSLTDGAYPMAVDNTYVFNVRVSNPFGAVGEDYKKLDVVIRGTGRIKVASRERYEDGTEKWYDESVIDLNTIADKFVNATFATDGTLNVKIIKSIESYYESVTRIDGGRTVYHKNKFREIVSPCSFTVLLTEPNTGIRTSFNVVIDPNAVTGVSVSKNEMVF